MSSRYDNKDATWDYYKFKSYIIRKFETSPRHPRYPSIVYVVLGITQTGSKILLREKKTKKACVNWIFANCGDKSHEYLCPKHLSID